MSGMSLVAEICFALRAYGGLDRLVASGAFPDLDGETADAIVEEGYRFAEAELLPLNQDGEGKDVRLADGTVTMPPGWREAYRRWAEAGWNALGGPPEWGGQGLPVVIQMALQEIWNAANPSFAVGPMLSIGAVHALLSHADDELKSRYLPKLVSGEWMVTMDLSEPQAGSELAAIKTRAAHADDGSYRIFGQKTFITFGDHDLTDNIVHLVLARASDSASANGGISMFLVPKVLDDGSRNDLATAGIEHKLGLHASPTCTLVYGEGGQGATGWLVGREGRGLICMFTMMNMERLTVGIQSVGVAARATQLALAYAATRRQGHAPGSAHDEMSVIGEHPDIQRQLMEMLALTAASRAICYACAEAYDMSRAAPAAERRPWADRAGLLTPIAKAFPSDAVIAVTSAGIQVHGGAGYVEETGAAQLFRDARVFSIYEGTNGIQAIDLATHKLKLGGGAAVAAVINEVAEAAVAVAEAQRPEFGQLAGRLAEAGKHLATATAYLAKALAAGTMQPVLAGATPYLKLFALAFGGALLAKGALGANDDNRNRAVALARFHGESLLGEAAIPGGGGNRGRRGPATGRRPIRYRPASTVKARARGRPGVNR